MPLHLYVAVLFVATVMRLHLRNQLNIKEIICCKNRCDMKIEKGLRCFPLGKKKKKSFSTNTCCTTFLNTHPNRLKKFSGSLNFYMRVYSVS